MLTKFIIIFFSKIFNLQGVRVCRFEPSCSQYAIKALERFNFFTAAKLIVIRLLKCHPFYPAGHDPVPISVRNG